MTNRNCPVCLFPIAKTLYSQEFIVPKDFPLDKGGSGLITQRIVACDMCGFVFVNTDLSQSDYDKYYAKFSQNTGLGTVDMNNYLVNIIETLCLADRRKDIIDIGCGSGALLFNLKSRGFTNLYGIDTSPSLGDIKGKAVSITDDLKDMPQFDVASMISVLEHILDVDKAISNVSSMLKEGAYLIILVPDASYYHKELTNPIHLINLEHINHFTKGTLDNLMNRHGFIRYTHDKYVHKTNAISSTQVMCVYRKGATIFSTDAERSVRMLVDNWKKKPPDKELERIRDSQEEVVVYGAGNYTYNMLAETALKDCNIIAFIDRNPNKQETALMGIPIYNPNLLSFFDGTIIISIDHEPLSIVKQLEEMGLNNKIHII